MNRHGSLNRIYRLVWSEITHSWVAVAETARGRGKRSARKLVASALALSTVTWLMPDAMAGPGTGTVVKGSASITQKGHTTTVDQTSQNTTIDWTSFNVGARDTVDFVQPNALSVAVNDILSNSASSILGNINANGDIFLINPNGMVFGKGAQVNVGGIVASGLAMNGNQFSGTGTVTNNGAINTKSFAVLLGSSVTNTGTITAPMGTLILGAGNSATLTLNSASGHSPVSLVIDGSTLSNLIYNGGLLVADGGTVILTAGAKNELLASVVNNAGVIEARSVANHNGTIELLADMGSGVVNVGGLLDASAPVSGNGGNVTTNADHVTIAPAARVTTLAAHGLTGSWIIDPPDFTIAASGGDETGAQLSASLGSSNVTISSNSGASGTSGNINVNDVVSWSANTLTLSAQNSINVNATMNLTGSAGLALDYALATGSTGTINTYAPVNLATGTKLSTFSTPNGVNVGGTINYIIINNLGQQQDASTIPSVPTLQSMANLQYMNSNYVGFALGSNINASATSTWNSGSGFAPIGNSTNFFTGTFLGLGHTISGLFINAPSNTNVGMFGLIGDGGWINGAQLVSPNVTGGTNVGALAGTSYGQIINSSASGVTVHGTSEVGGLVGVANVATVNTATNYLNLAAISNSFATGTVTATGNDTGGLIGHSYGSNDTGVLNGSINNCYFNGSVSGNNSVGGLVGHLDGDIPFNISNSYANAIVSGNQMVGGLVGFANYSNITNSYSTGSVSASKYAGGLIGWCQDCGITETYSMDSVSAPYVAGGLVGADTIGQIYYSYSTGKVSGARYAGGSIGYMNNSAINGITSTVIWNTTVNGGLAGLGGEDQPSTSNLVGLTTAQMTTGANFGIGQFHIGPFNFTSTPGATGNNWVIVDVDGSLNNAISTAYPNGAPGATFPMLASEYSNLITSTHQLQLIAMNPAASYTLAANLNASATQAGATPTDVWATTGGFVPLGTIANPFTGKFNGAGHTISNLYINLPGNTDVGLFGAIGTNAVLQNVTLSSVNITGGNDTGGLAGNSIQGTVNNSSTSGTVNGADSVGGVVGLAQYGSISGSNSSATVQGVANVGGLGGALFFSTVSTSSATGGVTGTGGGNNIGGFVGEDFHSTYTGSYATGNVIGSHYNIGGFAGFSYGTISDCFATGTVSASISVAASLGGLVGSTASTANISNSYATGQTGTNGAVNVGGLVGDHTGTISNSYSSGLIIGNLAVATINGLVGDNKGVVTNSFYSDSSKLGAGTPMTSAQFENQSNFTSATAANGNVNPNWDFNNVWFMYQGETFPLLRSFMTPLTVTAQNITTTYTGSAYTGGYSATYSPASVQTSLLSGALSYSGSAQGAVNASQTGYSIVPGGLYSSQLGYLINFVPGTLFINPESLTVGTSSVVKTYDGTTVAASAAPVLLSGTLYNGDTLSGGSFAFTDPNAGAGNKTVTASGITVANAADAGNYVLTDVSNTTSTINPEPLTVSTSNVVKTYDATTATSGPSVTTLPAPVLVNGTLYNGDTLAGGSFAFTDPNAGVGNKTVTTSGITTANTADASNYVFTDVSNTTSTINKAPLTINNQIPVSKTYDNNTDVSFSFPTFSGIQGNDAFNLSISIGGSFITSNAGTGVSVIANDSMSGTASGNYNLIVPTGLSANIYKEPITISSTSVTKTYDSTTATTGASVTVPGTVTISGILYGDTLTAGSYAFTDPNAGTGKTIAGSGYAIANNLDAGNYAITVVSNTTSTINQAPITISSSAVVKTYDNSTSTTDAAVTTAPVVTRTGTLYNGDSVTAGSYIFTNPNAGTGKTITGSGYFIVNTADANNYEINVLPNTASTITPAPITVSSTAAVKTYNNSTSVSDAAVTTAPIVTVTGTLYNGDSLTPGSYAFTDPNAGTGKTIAGSGYAIANSADAGNYTLTVLPNTASTINPEPLAVSTGNVVKTYDGSTGTSGSSVITAPAALVVSGTLYNGDNISGGSFAFTNPNAGSGNKTVTTSGVTIANSADAGNYVLTDVSNTTSTINPASITVSSTAAVKTYNNSTSVSDAAVITAPVVTITGALYNGDTLTTGSYAFTNPNAGTDKTIAGSGYAITNSADAGNYVVNVVPNSASTIVPELLTLSSSAAVKTYNNSTSTTDSAVTTAPLVTMSGTLYNGDVLTPGSYAFTNPNAGTGKTITGSGYFIVNTADANNYEINVLPNTASTITPAPITVSSTAAVKTYNSSTSTSDAAVTTAPIVTVTGALFNGDAVTPGSYAFTDPNAGTGKTIAGSGFAIANSADANNYAITVVPNTASTINPESLTVSTGNVVKSYDGSTGTSGSSITTAPAAVLVNGTLYNGDALGGGSFAYTNPNAGVGNKTVTVSGVAIANAADAGNYVLTDISNTTSTINPASITVSSTAAVKTYNNSTSTSDAAVTTAPVVTVTGALYNGDALTPGSYAFTDPNAGTGKTIAGSGYAIANSADAGNYAITVLPNTASTITPAPITVSSTAAVKTYNSSTSTSDAAVTTAPIVTVTGALYNGDAVTPGSYAFTDPNAGTGKTIAGSGYAIANSADAGNYAITVVPNTASTITPAPITVSSTAAVKTYNSSTSTSDAAVTTAPIVTVTGALYNGDAVTPGSYAFTDPNAGTGKTIAGSGFAIANSADANNYAITVVPNTASTINPESLTVSTGNVVKTYDGSTSTSGSSVITAPAAVLVNGTLYNGDALGGGSFAYTNPNAGVGNKTVTASGIAITNSADAGNYVLTDVSNTTSTINPASITVSSTAAVKTYNNSTSTSDAAVTTAPVVTISGALYNGDVVTPGSYAFTDPNAGTGKTIAGSGYAIANSADAGNYAITVVPNTASTITPAPITVSSTAAVKTYNSSTSTSDAAVTTAPIVTVTGALYNGDAVTPGSYAFTDPNAGTGKTIAGSGYAIANSADANNYAITVVPNTASTINPESLTVSTGNVVKSYDGSTGTSGSSVTTAPAAIALIGTLYNGDALGGGSFAYTNPNAGVGNKTVTVSGVAIANSADAGNYVLTDVSNTTSTINPESLTVSTSNVVKTYNGSTATSGSTVTSLPAVVIVSGALYNGDTLAGGSFAYTDPNAGVLDKTVTVSGVTIANATDAHNYVITDASNTTSTINPESITVSTSAVIKTYDGTTGTSGASVTKAPAPILVSGKLYNSDTLTGGSFAFTDPNAGALDKTVTASGISIANAADAGNYVLTDVSNTASTINPEPLKVSTSNVVKTYDASTSTSDASVTTLPSAVVVGGSLYNGDALAGGSFVFSNPNAGVGNKTVTTSGIAIANAADAGNYAITDVNNTTSTINPEALTVSTSSVVKTYNGSTATTGSSVTTAPAAVLLGGTLFNGDTLAGGSFAFTDPNAGAGNKTVTAAGITTTNGADAHNYVFTDVSNTTSTINPEALTVSTSNVVKTYDGTDATSGLSVITAPAPVVLAGKLYNSDALTGGSFAYTDPNAGALDKTVTVSGISIANLADAGNYVLTDVSNTTSTIKPEPLKVSTSNVVKTYDGSTSTSDALVSTLPALVIVSGTLYNGDTLAGGSFAFSNPNAGVGNKTITTSGIAIANAADAGNYAITDVNNTTSTINPEALTVSTSNVVKTYNGSTSTSGSSVTTAPAAVLLGGTLYNGDTLAGGSFVFTDPNAGAGNKTVTAAGITTATAADAHNYVFTDVSNTTSTINPEALTVSTSNVVKTYDGTDATSGLSVSTAPAPVILVGKLYNSDALTGGSFAYTDPNAGAGNKTVTASGISIANAADAGNYVLTDVSNTTSTIKPEQLTATGTALNKVYDGTTVATMSNAMLAGVIAGQTINLSESGVFSSANVGLRGVKVSDTISAGTGTQLSNYVLTDTTFNTTATISPATLTYLANLQSIPVGTSTAGLLSGVVDNALGQIVVNAKGQFEISGLTGTLAWTTNATSSSVAGSYYIDGSGLSANYGDYVFVQAPANAAALSVTGSSSSAASTTGTAITPVSLSQVQPAVAPGTVSNTVAVQVLPVIESPLLDRDRSKLQRSNRQTHLDIVNGGVRLANL